MYRTLQRMLDRRELQTISVDIFDTILLRTIHPEARRFKIFAKRELPILQKICKAETITPMDIVSLRAEVTDILRTADIRQGGDGEISIEDIAEGIVRTLAVRQDDKRNQEDERSAIDGFIDAELSMEATMLRPNRRLRTILKKAKESGVRIFFLTDMYLRHEHIRSLLRQCECDDLFDGGASSADIGVNKGSGHAYRRMLVESGFPEIDLATHVHIGDHPYCDVIAARASGITALHYHPLLRMACIRIASTLWNAASILSTRRWRRNLAHRYRCGVEEEVSAKKSNRVAFHIGTVLAPGIATYLSHLHGMARKQGRTICFISGEAPFLASLMKKMFPETTAVQMPDINRIVALRALLGITLGTQDFSSDRLMARWLIKRFSERLFVSFLRNLAIPTGTCTSLMACMRDAWKGRLGKGEVLIQELRSEYEKNSGMQSMLTVAMENVDAAFPEELVAGKNKLLFADLGWQGTIQYLIQLYVEKRKHAYDIHGLYLGTKIGRNADDLYPKKAYGVLFSPEKNALRKLILTESIWEYALERREGDEKNAAIRSGIEAGVGFVRRSASSSSDLCAATLPELVRFINLPSHAEARCLAAVPFDLNLGTDIRETIITSEPSDLLFFQPRKTMRRMAEQLWPAGFLRVHGLVPALWTRYCIQRLRAFRGR